MKNKLFKSQLLQANNNNSNNSHNLSHSPSQNINQNNNQNNNHNLNQVQAINNNSSLQMMIKSQTMKMIQVLFEKDIAG